MLAFLLGSLFGIALIIVKKKTLKSQIPFGPFLASGALITVLFFDWFSFFKNW